MKQGIMFLTQMAGIWFIYLASKWLVTAFHIKVPASVVGMIVLFVLLQTGIIKVTHIDKAALFLNKHVALFFIPLAVGLMKYGGLLKANGLQLLVMIAGSTLIGLFFTAAITQRLSRRKVEQSEQSHSL